ncbi:alkaline phosphatase synthesis sensor protein PhoR [mine drainage metagenome]|uniref:histidine kinase n=1 Tax=mine drainage metagenome TaxID=410659 RepID=A0A1J5SWG3_9ZZZZ
MSLFSKHKLVVLTSVYWLMLFYILAALFWWFIALNHQNKIMADLRLQDVQKNDPQFAQKQNKIIAEKKRKTAQYIGEGTIFLALILVGAVFVYRATRRQIKLSQQQQNFMMAVTHELKTPIAVTRLNLETLLKRKLETDKQERLISHTIQETDRLNVLCNNILLASQLEAGSYRITKQEINLSELIHSCASDFKTRFPQRKIDTIVQENIYIESEELLLQMLVNNLIDNALKYSPKESIVVVSLNEADNKIKLQVSNEGNSLTDDEKKKVFKKFYRTGNENTRKTKGTGLGLYLCRKIMEDHNGKIVVADNQPSGTIFTATFHSS